MAQPSTFELSRRKMLGVTSAAIAVGATAGGLGDLSAGETPLLESGAALPSRPDGTRVLMPRDRVPLSFVIDDSTCLVNMGHFCTPQFAAAWPDRSEYKKPWQQWPREIPDAFVRKFGLWCAEHGVKGKYSVVPNPACVGWLDRQLPGWSQTALEQSLDLVRELMVPNWDIHPEMITHTRVIDLKTGRPMQAMNSSTMENSFPQEKKSVDELAAYLAYALRILKNCGLPCEGVTTPGGFGNRVKSELSLAVDEAVREVYPKVDLPHYFKYVNTGDQSTTPKLEHLRNVGTEDVRLTMNVPAGTGDWFGGWQGYKPSQPDLYCNRDATAGRMVELIKRREPAVMLCHWPGIYSNGSEEGFQSFQRIVLSLADRFGDETIWMKLSEMGRYWAAKALTEISREGKSLRLEAPFAANDYTLEIASIPEANDVRYMKRALKRVESIRQLVAGTWCRRDDRVVACFDLVKGTSELSLG